MNKPHPLPALHDHPSVMAKADLLRRVEQADAEAVLRLAQIDALLATTIDENPADVLFGKRPADLEGLQAEHIELRNKRARLANSRRAFSAQLDSLTGELSVAASGDVLKVAIGLADDYLQALRVIRSIEVRERDNLTRLSAAGYQLVGLNQAVAAHVDWETLEREAARELHGMGARIHGIAEAGRKAA